jgi:hypothetical protein
LNFQFFSIPVHFYHKYAWSSPPLHAMLFLYGKTLRKYMKKYGNRLGDPAIAYCPLGYSAHCTLPLGQSADAYGRMADMPDA